MWVSECVCVSSDGGRVGKGRERGRVRGGGGRQREDSSTHLL